MKTKENIEKKENKTVWTQFRHVDEIIEEAWGLAEKEAEEILREEDEAKDLEAEARDNYVRDAFDWGRI